MRKNISFQVLAFCVIIVFACFTSCDKISKRPSTPHLKVVLRDIGHQLLLKNLDSTSAVLPVTEVESSKYQLSFSKQMAFLPNDLVTVIDEGLKKGELNNVTYRVEAIECATKEVIYSYEISTTKEKTIVPCLGRLLPHNCYHIQIDFLDGVDTDSNTYWVFYLLCIVILILGLLFFFKSRTAKSNTAIQKDFKSIGSYKFYPEQLLLTRNIEEIKLSKKECEILELLVAQPNQIISREILTKKVWEDNGVVVGRSLDTYISKLRKKLKEDNAIKLTNVHGVGYKLVIEK